MRAPDPARRALAALVLSALGTVAASPAPAPLHRVAEAYRRLHGYRVEAVMRIDVSSTTEHDSLVAPMTFLGDRTRATLLATRLDPSAPSRTIADGESLWVAAPGYRQYVVYPVHDTHRAEDDRAAIDAVLDPMREWTSLDSSGIAAEPLGPDTVRVQGGAAACERYRLTMPAPEGSPPGTPGPVRVLWVERATGFVRMDSTGGLVRHPQLGFLRRTAVTRFLVVRPESSFADSTFRPAGLAALRRVHRLIPPSDQHVDLEGQPAEDFELAQLGGGNVQLSALRGQVVVLDFWATWCGPCRGWMPIVEKVHRELASRGLRVFAVNEREEDFAVKRFLEKQGVEVPVLMDREGRVGSRYRANAIPETVIIGRDGRVSAILVGLHSEADLRAVLADAGIE